MNVTHASIGIIRALLDRKILVTYEKEVGRLNHGSPSRPENMKPLNEAQTEAYNQILIQMMGHRVTLLHGVTSRGKTEIYITLFKRLSMRRSRCYIYCLKLLLQYRLQNV